MLVAYSPRLDHSNTLKVYEEMQHGRLALQRNRVLLFGIRRRSDRADVVQ